MRRNDHVKILGILHTIFSKCILHWLLENNMFRTKKAKIVSKLFFLSLSFSVARQFLFGAYTAKHIRYRYIPASTNDKLFFCTKLQSFTICAFSSSVICTNGVEIDFEETFLLIDHFQKVSFDYHFIKVFERKFHMTVLMCRIICQIFDKMLSKKDFLEIINLYI